MIEPFPDRQSLAAWCINTAHAISGGDLKTVLNGAHLLLLFVDGNPELLSSLDAPSAEVTVLHPVPKAVQ